MTRLGVMILTVWFLHGCYTIRQGYHQGRLWLKREEVDAVIADDSRDLDTKRKLKLAGIVINYAGELGFNVDGAYREFIQTDSPYVSYLVQAAYSDRLEFKTWWFPVVGRVPYLGFFDERERDEEAASLKEQGFDVTTGGVGAFSSLGWFEDPLFSSMLKRSDEDFIHLLFHELTHRTVWVKGDVKFNENLAEVVAEHATLQFLNKFPDYGQVVFYKEYRSDRELFRNWLSALTKELSDFYGLPKSADFIELKAKVFRKYQTPPLRPHFKKRDFIGKELWNNADVLGAELYTSDPEPFEKAIACEGSLKSFFKALKENNNELLIKAC